MSPTETRPRPHRSPAVAPREARIDVEVRYAETDQMGVVHHSNYLIWFELARTSLCAASGHPYDEIERAGYLIMVSGASLRYRAGATYGDTVTVICRLERLASRALTFSYEVRRGDDLLATGTTDHVWMEVESGRACRIPTPYREAFAGLEAAS